MEHVEIIFDAVRCRFKSKQLENVSTHDIKEDVQADELVVKYNKIVNMIQETDLLEHVFNHVPLFRTAPLATSGEATDYNDAGLVARIITEYQRQAKTDPAITGFWDKWTTSIKKDMHEALLAGDAELVASMLRNPASTNLFHGFEAIASPLKPAVSSPPAPNAASSPPAPPKFPRKLNFFSYRARLHYDALLSLADAVGARRLNNPEVALNNLARLIAIADFDTTLDVDSLLDQIEKEVGVELSFPNPFPKETGLASKRGIMSYKAILSVYQGWRIARASQGNPDFKVMEIGAGLGRAAYYARLFGVKNYTIVDIPLTNVAQSYYLGHVLGDDALLIGSETTQSESGLRILSSVDFENHNEQYDLIFNCDSMPEMPRQVAQSYWDFARKATKCFLSINHEHNAFTVRELYKQYDDIWVKRHLCPVRRGYAEEMIGW